MMRSLFKLRRLRLDRLIASAALQRTVVGAAVCSALSLAHAQGLQPAPLPLPASGVGSAQRPAPKPLLLPAAPLPNNEGLPPEGEPQTNPSFGVNPANPRADRTERDGVTGASAALGSTVFAPAAVRNWSLEPSVTVRTTATDNSRLSTAKKKELFLEVSPQVAFRTTSPRLRLDSTLGLDQVAYLKDSFPDRIDPRASLNLNSTLIDNFLFLDAGAQVDRRAPTPFGVQSRTVDPGQRVRTKVFRFSPYVLWRSQDGLSASLRSDNDWSRRSSPDVASADKVYSQNTRAVLTKEPQPFGAGLELRDQSLRYNNESSVLHLQNALVSLGYAFDPQFVLYALAGQERNSFAPTPGLPVTSETDSDYGLRLRWTPLERSVLTAEARQRFFGTSYAVQWNHRSPFLGLQIAATKEPNTQPETVRLAGDLIGQFDAIFRARGFNASQRQSLVRSTLNEYALPDNLNEPTNVYLSRAQLATAFTAELTLLGRRTVTAFSVYRRKLEQLTRNGVAPAPFAGLGDVDQRGVQALLTFRLTPILSLEGGYRFDRSQGLGLDTRQTKENLFTVGSRFALSPRTGVALGLQHLSLNSSGSATVKANSATLGMTHRF
jgi:uncharacterized protein (PEP-CTERM system associated)